jgi:hypothetical protein
LRIDRVVVTRNLRSVYSMLASHLGGTYFCSAQREAVLHVSCASIRLLRALKSVMPNCCGQAYKGLLSGVYVACNTACLADDFPFSQSCTRAPGTRMTPSSSSTCDRIHNEFSVAGIRGQGAYEGWGRGDALQQAEAVTKPGLRRTNGC